MVSTSEGLDSNYFSSGPAKGINTDSSNNIYEKGSYTNTSTETSNIVTSQAGKRISVDFRRTRDILECLSPHGNEQITNLKGELREKFDNILEISKHIHMTSLYSRLFDQVKDVFHDEYPNPIPGTVAAFFIGCIVTGGNFKGPKGCDPRCTGSLPPPSGKKCQKCDQVCLLYDEKGLIRPLNNVKNNNGIGYIVILGKNFKGFTNKDISTFQRKGITNGVTLLHFYDGKYHEQVEIKEMCKLPKCNDREDNHESSDDSGIGTVGVVLAILAIIVVLGFIVYYFFGRKGYDSGSGSGYINDPYMNEPNFLPRNPVGYTGKLKYY